MFELRPNRLPPAPLFLSLAAALLVGACENPAAQAPSAASFAEAMAGLDTVELIGHVEILASDAFQGRAPSSEGEQRTLDYLEEQFAVQGLQPGGHDGNFFQEVPLVSITADPSMALTVSGDGLTNTLAYGTDFVAWTTKAVEEVDLDASELVFVGYGIVAPEYGWNDYEGVDVAGKTLVALVNDPGFATQDPDLFQGNAMTYYGRWTYKYEEAARQGAVGLLLIHETEPAAYGWATVESSWTGPQFGLTGAGSDEDPLDVEAWITLDAAQALFQRAGLEFYEQKSRAMTREFQAEPMGSLTASLTIRNTLDYSTSHNVLARVEGTLRRDEVIIYMAHWDHLGVDPSLEGDSIYNGALDNATGVAALLELAEAFGRLDPAPQRSIVFLATTAEEQGLLGSEYYAENPVYPLEKTVAAINIDGLSIYGPTHDYVVIGYGNSDLDEIARSIAEPQDRTVEPDPEREKGYFYRSDHFPLAKKGVPAHYGSAGFDVVGRGEEYGQAMADEWVAEHYHQTSDDLSGEWALGGALQDLRLWFHMGVDLGYSDAFPQWYEGTEFKGARDAMIPPSGS